MNHIEKQLRQYEINKLAEWFDIFNSWEFPKDFPFPKPQHFDTDALWYSESNPYGTKYDVIKPYINVIRKIIGLKECLRYHHIHNLKMKNYEFEIWWFFNNVNEFIQKYLDENFYIDIYSIIGKRKRWKN